MDWIAFNNAFTLADVLTSISAVAVALLGVYVVVKGVYIVLELLTGNSYDPNRFSDHIGRDDPEHPSNRKRGYED